LILPVLLPKVGWTAGSSKNLPLFKVEALKDIHGLSCATFPCIENTSIENMVSNSLRYSINSHESSSQVCDGVTLAGDDSHPLAPNIGQGASCTLEDAMFFGKSFLQH
jgi:hypothetical protein